MMFGYGVALLAFLTAERAVGLLVHPTGLSRNGYKAQTRGLGAAAISPGYHGDNITSDPSEKQARSCYSQNVTLDDAFYATVDDTLDVTLGDKLESIENAGDADDVSINDAFKVLEETDFTTAVPSESQEQEQAQAQNEAPTGFTNSQSRSSSVGAFCLGSLLGLVTVEPGHNPLISAVVMGALCSGAAYVAIETKSPVSDLLVATLADGTEAIGGSIKSFPESVEKSMGLLWSELNEGDLLESKIATVKALEKELLNRFFSINVKEKRKRASTLDDTVSKLKIQEAPEEAQKLFFGFFERTETDEEFQEQVAKTVDETEQLGSGIFASMKLPSNPIGTLSSGAGGFLHSTKEAFNSVIASQKPKTDSELSKANAVKQLQSEDDLLRHLRFFTAPGLDILPNPKKKSKTDEGKKKEADELVTLDKLSGDFMKLFKTQTQQEQQEQEQQQQDEDNVKNTKEVNKNPIFLNLPSLDIGVLRAITEKKSTTEEKLVPHTTQLPADFLKLFTQQSEESTDSEKNGGIPFFRKTTSAGTDAKCSEPIFPEGRIAGELGLFAPKSRAPGGEANQEKQQKPAGFNIFSISASAKSQPAAEKTPEATEESRVKVNPLLSKISVIAGITDTRSGTISVEDGLNRKQKRAIKERKQARETRAKVVEAMREAREVYKVIEKNHKKGKLSIFAKPEVVVPKRSRTELIEKAPPGIPTMINWRRERDGSVSGNIIGSKVFPKNEYITTSPIAGAVMPGTVVQTKSGSEYFLAPHKKPNGNLKP